MATPSKYRFSIKAGENGTFRQVKPTWGDESKIKTEIGSGEMYYRETLDANFTFTGIDFDFIKSQPFDTKFFLYIELSNNNTFENAAPVSYFYKTDCNFDADARQLEVKPISSDLYEDVLGGMDKTFNLVDILPETTPVSFAVQPVFQVHFFGSNVVNNLLGGVYFESPVDNSSGDLAVDYFFGSAGTIGIMIGSGQSLSPDVSGEYVLETSDLLNYRSKDGVFRLEREDLGGGDTRWVISRVSDSQTLYVAPTNELTFDEIEFSSLTSNSKTVFRSVGVFVRLLTNALEVNGTPTDPIPENDIVANHGNYTRVLRIGLGATITPNYNTSWQDVFLADDGHQSDPERFGKFPDGSYLFEGEYFSPPTGSGIDSIYPLSNSEWKDSSFWFKYDDVLREFQESGAEARTINDAYKLPDVISAILGQISESVTHSEAVEYSDFFYSNNNEIRGARRFPVIVPKSNILVGEYDTPAKIAEIKLSELFQLLRVFHNCFWFIDNEGRFKIEHYQYFRNGGSYNEEKIGVELSVLKEPRTGKRWAFGQNKWSYSKQDLPERLEFDWMDRCSRPFKGYAIDINSGYVENGNIKSNKIGRFSSDIDFINVSPSDISNDGFVFLECEDLISGLVVPFVEVSVTSNESYKLQNGYASFVWGHNKYFPYGLPAPNVNLNRQDRTAATTKRAKIQKVSIAGLSSINPYQLINSDLGNGKLETMERGLSGNSYEITLKHSTE